MEKRWLNITEAAEYVGIPKNTLYFLVHKKRVPHVKHVRRLKFDIRELDRWMEEAAVPVAEDN